MAEFKVGDIVRVVTEIGKTRVGPPQAIEKLHKGNGNAIVGGCQFSATSGRGTASGWHPPRIVFDGSDECAALLDKVRRERLIEKLSRYRWHDLPTNVLSLVHAELESHVEKLGTPSAGGGG